MSMTIRFLPARYGDAIWIAYTADEITRYILIDGGTAGTRNDILEIIRELPEDKRHIELVIISHIDRDHIEGILALFELESLPFTFGDIWFNSWQHLGNSNYEHFGAEQGERLTMAIRKHKSTFNRAFRGNAVVVPNSGALPEIILPGGLKITLLSPYAQHLEKLKSVWEKEILENGMSPGWGNNTNNADIDSSGEYESFGLTEIPDVEALNQSVFDEDSGIANGSSIACCIEFMGKRVLLSADAHPSTLLSSLQKMPFGSLSFDLVKLSHHGSKHSTTPKLIEQLSCKNYVISTSGARFKHPDQETIAWILKRSDRELQLSFNYLSEYNKIWDTPLLKKQYEYTTLYPVKGKNGIEFKY